MNIKEFVNSCLHEALGLPKDVALVIDQELAKLSYTSVLELIEDARLSDLTLPEGWGMPRLLGASVEEVMRTYLSQLMLSMSYEGLRLQRIRDMVVFPGQIS